MWNQIYNQCYINQQSQRVTNAEDMHNQQMKKTKDLAKSVKKAPQGDLASVTPLAYQLPSDFSFLPANIPLKVNDLYLWRLNAKNRKTLPKYFTHDPISYLVSSKSCYFTDKQYMKFFPRQSNAKENSRS